MAGFESRDELAHSLRASDVERERVVERLRTAAAHGRLDVDELDKRLSAAFAGRTRGELEALTADLPDSTSEAVGAPSHADAPMVRPAEVGEGWIVSVMSGNDRTGPWRLAPRVRVVNVMGGSDLDLTQAELTAPVTELTVVSVMGGSEIRVPHGTRVEVSRFGFMGGNDVALGSERPPDDAPVVRVRLFAFMGGNDVRRGPEQSRAQRRLERRRRRDLDKAGD